MMRPKRAFFLTVALCSVAICPSWSENVVFPPDSGVVDLTKAPYFAKGDGITDCTASLQKALNDHTGRGSILYLPNGAYLISASLKLPLKNARGETQWGRFHLQGQSRAGTVLCLKDSTFLHPERSEAMLTSGPHGSADWFHNSVRNLTFDIGRNNPGAIAGWTSRPALRFDGVGRLQVQQGADSGRGGASAATSKMFEMR